MTTKKKIMRYELSNCEWTFIRLLLSKRKPMNSTYLIGAVPIGAVALFLTGCASMTDARRLAEQAQVHPNAPILAEVSEDIEAPVAVTWRIFSDVNDWPHWNRDAPGAKIDGEFKAGTPFEYGSHKLTLAKVEPQSLVSFYGTPLAGYAGITIWRFQSVSPTSTRVTVQESSVGPLISVLYSNKKLEQHLRLWTTSLKSEAERQAATTGPGATK